MKPYIFRNTFAKFAVLSLLITGAIITYTGCSKTPEPVESDNYFLDTTCHISIYSTDDEGGLDEQTANAAMKTAWDLCRKLDKTLSKTVKSSDVSRINSAGGEWVEVSDYTVELLKKSIYYSKLSDGDFDPTIGRITDLWDYHSDNPKVPDDSTIKDALAHVDYRRIEIDGNRVRLTDPESKLDLGGIAKGYIGDCMAASLRKSGITSAILNLGGNIIALGSKPADKPFVIGVEKPYSDRSEIFGSVEVRNSTVVTSGVYERQFKKNGKTYHHILSTETGYPADTDIDAVTLVTDEGHSVDADALSTICLIKGYKKASRLIESIDGIEACFSFPDGKVRKTSGMEFNEE